MIRFYSKFAREAIFINTKKVVFSKNETKMSEFRRWAFLSEKNPSTNIEYCQINGE